MHGLVAMGKTRSIMLRVRVTVRFFCWFGLEYAAWQSWVLCLVYICVCLSVQATQRDLLLPEAIKVAVNNEALLASACFSEPEKNL